jgi:hypothetical protein
MKPSGNLEGAVAKLSRGYLDLIALQQQIQARFPPAQTWPLRTEEHRAGLEYRFYLGEIPEVDPEWPLVASEILFNVRCSLDYLVYELHVRRYRGNVPKGVAKASMFPIFSDRSDYRSKGVWRIKNLSKRDRGAIEDFQPYDARINRWYYVRHFLSALAALQNIDKHRQLHVVTTYNAGGFGFNWPDSCGFEGRSVYGPINSGDQIDTWTFTSPPPQMHDHAGAVLAVAIEAEGQQPSVLLGQLREILDASTFVLERFGDRFPKVGRPVAWRWGGIETPPLPAGARWYPLPGLFGS